MKKLIRIFICSLFVIAICLGLASCYDGEYRQREEQLLAIQGKGGHIFVNNDGYVKDNQLFDFYDLIISKVQKDNATNIPVSSIKDKSDVRLYADIHNEFAYYTMQYNANYQDNKADMILGYINVRTNAVVYFNTQISTEEYSGLQLNPYCANDNYFIFKMLRESIYYVIDVKSNVLIEKIYDINPYKDGTENDSYYVYVGEEKYKLTSAPDLSDNKKALKYGDETLVLDYRYVRSRSEEMKQIDSIVGGRKGEIMTNLITYKNTLYIVFETKVGVLVSKNLKPIVFEYKIETDSFEYIGYTNLLSYNHVFGVVPCA